MLGTGLALASLGPSEPRLQQWLTRADGLPDKTIRALCVDEQGVLWAGTQAGLAVVEVGTITRCLGTSDGLPAPQINALCCDSLGRVWTGTDEGLAVIAGGVVQGSPICDSSLASRKVQHLCLDRAGDLWVGFARGDLIRIAAGTTSAEKFPFTVVRSGGASINVLQQDCRGRLWVGTKQGADLYVDGILCDAFGPADGLPSPNVQTLHGDRAGRVWAGTDAGLGLLASPELPVRAPTSLGTPDQNVAWAFAEDNQDRLWAGTLAGLQRADREGLHVWAPPDLPPPVREAAVRSLCIDQCGQLWVGTRREGLFCLDPSTLARRAHLLQEDKADLPDLCAVGPHHLWVASPQRGLACIDVRTRDIVAEVGTAAGMPDLDVRSLAVDRQGRLWAGTVSGRLVCIEPAGGNLLHTIDLCGCAVPFVILGLCCDAAGLLWACTGAGLFCIDPAQPAVIRAITVADGLPSDFVYSCCVDRDRYLWLGTQRGVVRFAPDEAQCVVLDQSQGLPHDDCNANALHLDKQGRLWIGTSKGIGSLDTAAIPDTVPPCQVYLTSFRVLGQQRDIVPDVQLEDSEYDLQFEYGAVSFVAPALVAYRTQLAGLEPDWSAASPDRMQRYTYLRPGAYVFRVSARNWGGVWSAPAELPFRIVRNRQAQAAEDALEQERIAKEVYRATAARLEELNRQLAMAHQDAERARVAAEDLARLRSSFVATVSHELRTPLTAIVGYAELLEAHWHEGDSKRRHDQIRRIVEAAHRQQHLVEDLLLLSRLEMGALSPRIHRVPVAELIERAADEVRTSYTGEEIQLEGPADLHIMADPERTVQILVNLLDNAAKYSPEGSALRVDWHQNGNHADVRVHDQGRGIPEEGRVFLFTPFGRVPGSQVRAGRVGTGLGLHLGRSLAVAMAGNLVLESTCEHGSVFRLSLPVA